jgi:uncharacterized protein (TIGR02757 family)
MPKEPSLPREELKALLDEKYDAYCRPDFIVDDPISIPHCFENKGDREVAGLIAATIAWGQRPTIIRNAVTAMRLMGNEPHRFVMEHSQRDLDDMEGFVHRTFNATDLRHFVIALRHIYETYGSLEEVFVRGIREGHTDLMGALVYFKEAFFSIPHEKRTMKHVADPSRGSSAKRLNMFLRWMVRDDGRGVDFGIWRRIPASMLSCPLDVHSGRVARQLGLLSRSQDDWRAVQELDAALRSLDPQDPVKYDFALFGMGVFEKTGT